MPIDDLVFRSYLATPFFIEINMSILIQFESEEIKLSHNALMKIVQYLLNKSINALAFRDIPSFVLGQA